MTFTIDWASKYSIENFVTKFGLICEKYSSYSFIVSILFYGEILGALAILQLGDVIGRKKLMVFGMVIKLAAQFLLFSTNQITLIYVGMFVDGICEVINRGQMVIYIFELSTK